MDCKHCGQKTQSPWLKEKGSLVTKLINNNYKTLTNIVLNIDIQKIETTQVLKYKARCMNGAHINIQYIFPEILRFFPPAKYEQFSCTGEDTDSLEK